MKKYVVRLVFSLLVMLVPLGAALATGTTPQLGLDLQGGISVVLAPVEAVDDAALGQAVDIIRNRVDALGVAEPEVSRQGDNITVDLPGVENQDDARSLVGTTAELRFRPVLQDLPAEGVSVSTTTTAPGATTTTGAGGAASSTTTTTGEDSSTTSTATQGGVIADGEGPLVAGQAATTTTATTAPTSATTAPATTPPSIPELSGQVTTTPPSEDEADAVVVLPYRAEDEENAGNRLRLGPTLLTGEVVDGAIANFQQNGWGVDVTFTGDGSGKFDAMAAQYVGQRVAIGLDSVVQSAPVIQTAQFGGEARISGDYTEGESRSLATVLRYGALPVELKEETVQAVSPTLGKDQLRSGIAAGLFGLGLVMLYMLAYYRLLGLVIWVGLACAGAVLYGVTAWLSQSVGLALTLAGVTGIIVSVGITVDSYVVYFERLKDEVRSGRTIRSSLDRGFARAFRTILAADLVSLIGAGLLYILAVGSVRGFAFFLGLSTVLDVFVAYFFMHPLVAILGRNPRFLRAGWLGIASGLDAKGATL